MTKHLYTPADVKKVREELLAEQGGVDALTGLPLSAKDAVTDHNHKTHHVRGIIHRQANAVLGKIENMHNRYLKFWYNDTLSNFLRKCADYLERGDDKRWLHPGWLKATCSKFNSLSEPKKKLVLQSLGKPEGQNAVARKAAFKDALMSRQFTLTQVEHIIKESSK